MVMMITSEEYKELIIKANKYDELQKPKMNMAENKIEKVEIKEIKPEEIAKIFDDLKNKILGGEK